MQRYYLNKKKYYFEAKWLISSGIIAFIFIGIWLTHKYFTRNVDQPLEVDFVVAKKDTIEITVSEIGIVEYGNQQILKSPNENATVEQVNAFEGSEIKAGESLILLRDRNAEEQKEQQIIENRKYQLNLELNRDKVVIPQSDLTLTPGTSLKLNSNTRLEK